MRSALLIGLAFLGASCGPLRFQRAWSNFEAPGERHGMEGRWRGEWRSEWNGHSGGLRCLLSRDAQDGRYQAWFCSTYAGILFFQYELGLIVTDEGGGAQSFRGEQDLGASFGGVYRYDGRVVQDQFRATFRADNGDHGLFEMHREE
jgi:hypothetical protein